MDSRKRGPAEEFCLAYTLPRSGRFSIRLDGEQGGMCLAKAWVQRMEFLMETWLARGGSDACEFVGAGIAGYVPPDDCRALPADACEPLRKRLASVLSLRPKRRAS